jgi:hypothetical protein
MIHDLRLRLLLPIATVLLVLQLTSPVEALAPGIYCGLESCYDGKHFHIIIIMKDHFLIS